MALQWYTDITCCKKQSSSGVPKNFVRQGEGVYQIQLRTEGRENGDVGVVAPVSGVPLNL
jgi:hypothetical protein